MKESLMHPMLVSLGVIVLLVLALVLLHSTQTSSEASALERSLLTTNRFFHTELSSQSSSEREIVYGTVLNDFQIQSARENCASLGGVFQACGNPCGASKEVCIDICGYTCTITPELSL